VKTAVSQDTSLCIVMKTYRRFGMTVFYVIRVISASHGRQSIIVSTSWYRILIPIGAVPSKPL